MTRHTSGPDPRSCDWCGRTDADDDALTSLAWTLGEERGRRRTFCPTCSREHLRAMEGKLDSEHW